MCCISVFSEIANTFFSLCWVDFLHTNLVSVILLNKSVWLAVLAVSPLHKRLYEKGVCAPQCLLHPFNIGPWEAVARIGPP